MTPFAFNTSSYNHGLSFRTDLHREQRYLQHVVHSVLCFRMNWRTTFYGVLGNDIFNEGV